MVASGPRVLVVLPVDAPSSLVRGGVYRQQLAADYQVTFCSLYLPHLARLRQRAAGVANPIARRLATAPFDTAIVATRAILSQQLLRTVSDFDRILLVKYFDARFVEAIRHRSQAQILYDIDDAVWLPEFIGPTEFARITRAVDAVSCDNGYLRERAARHNQRAFILRGPVQLLPVVPRPALRPTIIAWIGSPSTLHYLKNLEAPLARLVVSHPGQFVFRVVGAGYDESQWPRVPGLALQTVPSYDERGMHQQLAEIDVGVFPLNQDENSLGRGILKATLYMSAGVPAVCSAIGELPIFLQSGIDGFACASIDDWYGAFVQLIEDAPLRQQIGERGRKKIEAEFSIDHCYAVLREQFLDR